MSVQDYLISQETKAMKQLAEITITKALPTMLDVANGMAKWLCGQSGSKKEGQQTLKHLTQYGDKLSEIPLDSESIKAFTHIARKNKVSFTLEKDERKTPPRHTVYFKANDTDSMMTAFKEYLTNELNKGKSKEQPFKERLNDAKARVVEPIKDKNMKREVER